MEWPSRFSLSINGAVTAYSLSLTLPHHHSPISTTTIYHSSTLQHQFEGLASNMTYNGRLIALVGQHHWPYNLLNFTIASPTLLTGLGLGQKATYGRSLSTVADLTSISVSVRLRWSPTPFLTGGFTPPSSKPTDPPEPAVRPLGYRLQVWDHNQLVREVITSIYSKDKGCEAAVGGLKLDTVYKATLEALSADDEPGTSLSFSLDAGALHVEGGGLTTDGVSECYSGLQVRCPGSERCVSPYWICDGAPDCPDGADEVGCDSTNCEGFKCWDEMCISVAWRCDGHRDCKEGDDEYMCTQCDPGELKCPKGGPCVSQNATCDGVSHCPDGWDESGAVCGFLTCGPGELRCLEGGQCVEHQRLCDGVPDCPSSEDEDLTFCAAFASMKDLRVTKMDKQPVECEKGRPIQKANCTDEEFRCDSGECIHRVYVCNGVDDCEKGEDEMLYACVERTRDDNHIHAPDDNDLVDEDEDIMTRDYDDDDYGDIIDEYIMTRDYYDDDDDGDNNEERKCKEDQHGNCVTPSHNTVTDDINNNSLTLDIPPTQETHTRTTLNVTNQESDSSNSLVNEIQVSESSTPYSSTTTEDNSLRVMKKIDISHPNVTDVDEVLDDKPEGEREDNTIQEGVDVSIEVVVEETAYPHPVENEVDFSSIEEFDNSLDDTQPLDTNLLFISHNLANGTATDNTTFVLDTPDDYDFNSTIPYLTTDNITDDSSDDYNASSSEEYDSSKEIVNSTNLVRPRSESNSTDELLDTGSASLEDDSDKADKSFTVTVAADPSSSESNIQSENKTIETSTPAYSSDELTTASHAPELIAPDASSETVSLNVTEAEEVVTLLSTEATLMESTPNAVDETTLTLTTTISPTSHENPVSVNATEPTTTEVHLPTEAEHLASSTETTSTVTDASTVVVESMTISSTLTTEPDNWKDMGHNLTILIAVHSEMNESNIPQYIIHGMDGNTYEYEIVSIVNDDKLAKEKKAKSNSSTSEGEAEKREKSMDERSRKYDGSHSYLQGNNVSSAERCSLSLISLILVFLLHNV
ncbi:dentin sialophosphoprotein-like [Homarus americanus]|nr:dentin sialophosphoprotein-like [Homarus americanus]